MIEEFDYHLKDPFEYAYKGEQQKASFLRLSAPTSRNADECAALKQAFLLAVADQEGAEVPEGQETPAPKARDMIALLGQSARVSLPEVYRVARKLLTSGVASVDGETRLTGPILERASMADFEEAVGEYLLRFTLASTQEATRG